MLLPAPLQLTAELRTLGHAPDAARAFRLTRAIGEEGLSFAADLPFEPGRPLAISLRLPDDEAPLALEGHVVLVRPDDEASEGESARPRAVAFHSPDADTRLRLRRYVDERILEP